MTDKDIRAKAVQIAQFIPARWFKRRDVFDIIEDAREIEHYIRSDQYDEYSSPNG